MRMPASSPRSRRRSPWHPTPDSHQRCGTSPRPRRPCARPAARFDLVRIGIGSYGIPPFGDGTTPAELGLRPAMTLRARIAAVRRVEAGAGASYGHTWRASRPTTLALVPLGYADGVPRQASNRAEVWLAGARRPIVGRIAMDQFLVDAGDAEVAVGDEVVLFGDPLTGAPSADDWGDAADTIGYEIVTRIGAARAAHLRGRRMMRVEAPGTADMEEFGRELGGELRAGDLVVLTGPLGAGKTTLTRGIGAGLGVRGPVQSPTFVLARTHPSLVGGAPLVHVDAYRLGSAALLDDLDLDFEHSVVVVEWGAGLVDDASESWLEILIERPMGASAAADAPDPDARSDPRRRMPRHPTSSTPTSRGCSRCAGTVPAGRAPATRRERRLADMLLAIDTSTGTSVAVVDREGGVLAEAGTDDTMRHAEVIGGFIRDALAAAEVEPARLSGVAAGMGPGPFTGLRVGIAAAHAFALGIDRPFVPVVSHDAVAWAWYRDGGIGPVQVVTDARRREFAVTEYDGLDVDGLPVRAGDPGLAPRDAVPPARGIRVDAAFVSAGAIGMLAELAFAAGRLPLADDRPLYLRAPDVTPSPGKRVLQ